jgi:hypothetical protein
VEKAMKEELISALKSGKTFFTHDCAFCDYRCNFFAKGEHLYFDHGCGCVKNHQISERPWSTLDFFLVPEHGHISKIEKFLELK